MDNSAQDFFNEHVKIGTVPGSKTSSKTHAHNLWGKTRPKDNPYLTVSSGGWTWRILKAYQTREAEQHNVYARWFCAVSSPMTQGGYDLGDTYVRDIPLDDAARAILAQRLHDEGGPK